jgi:hypothetical protein
MVSVFLLNSPELDSDHQHLEEVIAQREPAIMDRASAERVCEFVAMLGAASRWHFAFDWELIERDRYEARHSHGGQHGHVPALSQRPHCNQRPQIGRARPPRPPW